AASLSRGPARSLPGRRDRVRARPGRGSGARSRRARPHPRPRHRARRAHARAAPPFRRPRPDAAGVRPLQPGGVLLLCLAEALLRVPDAETIDDLIEDKLGRADWESHISPDKPLFVNAATWMLMLTGSVLAHEPRPEERTGQ